MAGEVERYLDLMRELGAAESRVNDLSAYLRHAQEALGYGFWRKTRLGVLQDQAFQSLRQAISSRGQIRTLDLSRWPSADEIRDALTEAQRLDKESREAWDSIPNEQRVALQPPRESY